MPQASTLNLPREWESIRLMSGAHGSREQGMCAMEAAAWIAGQPHSDHPPCVCPVIGAFMRRWNDDLGDEDRQILKPLIPKIVGTKSTSETQNARAWLATDWIVRVHTPAWLDLAGLTEQAAALHALAEITKTSLTDARPVIDEARSKAAAVGAAAGAAAWNAARAAARVAAWNAARAAAKEKLQPAVKPLQQSAIELVERMAALGSETRQ